MRSSLPRKLENLLGNLRAALPENMYDSEAGTFLSELTARLKGPLRVAVVGQIKVGKSTLMNALLHEALLPTGVQETTYNINWLHYGASRKAVIRWKDGRSEEPIDIAELQTWTRRLGAPSAADDIRYLDVFAPNEILRRVELIDTPGLYSSHEVDSQKTASFLRLVDDASDREASEADAVVFVFARGIHESDEAALRAFRQAAEGRVSPLNAVGVLAQIDRYWPSASIPMDAAKKIIQNLKTKEQIRNSLFDIVAVAALPAFGAATLDADGQRALTVLVQLDEEVFRILTSNAKRFLEQPEDDCGVSRELREVLYDNLGLYGICRVRTLAQNSELQEAVKQLREESGILDLMHILEVHFGQRAMLIKALYGLVRVRQLAARMRDCGGATERVVGEAWRIQADEFVLNTADVLRLEMLRSAYASGHDLSSGELDEIKLLAGERGLSSLHDASSDVRAQSERRISYWRARANEAREMGSKSEFVARAMCRLLEFSLSDEGRQ